jgi:hypothetical protein
VARRKRSFSTFNLSFLDIMSCGFGAVVLVFLIIDHSIEVESRELNVDLLSEVTLLEEDIREGEENLVALRNSLEATIWKSSRPRGGRRASARRSRNTRPWSPPWCRTVSARTRPSSSSRPRCSRWRRR